MKNDGKDHELVSKMGANEKFHIAGGSWRKRIFAQIIVAIFVQIC